MLEEIGEPYELTIMSQEEGAGEEHRRRHPLGRVPVLEDGDGFLFESAAICLHLADLHPEAELIPLLGTRERALVYQWTIFPPAELEQPLIEAATQAARDPERAAAAREVFYARADAVSDALEGTDYLVGGRFTVADVLVGSALGFAARSGFDGLSETVMAYIARLIERPAYQRAAQLTGG